MNIIGKDGKSWELPLSFDDELQPLYRGPPLPLCVLKASNIEGDDGRVGVEGTSYESADPEKMAEACRQMAGWKLAGNGKNVARFAARGGPKGAKNPRKGFGAELADPYAAPDEALIPYVETSLQLVCKALLANGGPTAHEESLKEMKSGLVENIDKGLSRDVASALSYLRDRTGVPRDLPLAAARQLRAHLNAAIDVLY
jgi:glutathione S-transferase